MEKATVRRLAGQIGSAFEAGATAVLVTCSSIGRGVAVARQMFDGPIFRVDEAMAAKAVTMGRRVGVLATLRTTLDPTAALIRESAAAARAECEVIERCCEGAFEAVIAGNGAAHDRLVAEGLLRLASEADVVALAQASMARVLKALPAGQPAAPVLTSPELAIEQIRAALA
jgi:Asp/Glu/hydantoin racemase